MHQVIILLILINRISSFIRSMVCAKIQAPQQQVWFNFQNQLSFQWLLGIETYLLFLLVEVVNDDTNKQI